MRVAPGFREGHFWLVVRPNTGWPDIQDRILSTRTPATFPYFGIRNSSLFCFFTSHRIHHSVLSSTIHRTNSENDHPSSWSETPITFIKHGYIKENTISSKILYIAVSIEPYRFSDGIFQYSADVGVNRGHADQPDHCFHRPLRCKTCSHCLFTRGVKWTSLFLRLWERKI